MTKVKTKLLLAVGVTTLLSTGLYAHAHKSECSKMHKSHYNEAHNHNKGVHKHMHSYKKSNSLWSMFYNLNLSEKQKQKIFDIKKDILKEQVSVDTAFTKNSFDKEKFIKIMKQKRENMLESKAEMIHRVYKILTSKQKEQLKVLLDLKKQKKLSLMDKRMNFDKDCNGRR